MKDKHHMTASDRSGISLKNNTRQPLYATLQKKVNAGRVAEYNTQDRPPMEAKASTSDRKRNKWRKNIGT